KIRCQSEKSGEKSGVREIRCQSIILARKSGVSGNPVSVHHSRGKSGVSPSFLPEKMTRHWITRAGLRATPDYARSPTHRAERPGTAHTAPQSPSCRSGRTWPQASKRQELDLAGPFLRFARGPDEKQALDDCRNRSALVGKKQTAHREARRQAGAGRFSHGVDIVGNHNPLLPSGMVKNFGIGPRRQAEVSKPRELDGRLAAQYARDNRVVQIVIRQEVWPAHSAVEPGTLLSARRRCTTGLGFCAAC